MLHEDVPKPKIFVSASVKTYVQSFATSQVTVCDLCRFQMRYLLNGNRAIKDYIGSKQSH